MINNSIFGKTMRNVRKQKDIKLVKTETRRNYLMSEPNYDATNFFFQIYCYQKWKKQISNTVIFGF